MALMVRKNNLREIRMKKGLSGYDLQLLCHVPAGIIYGIERGLKKPLPYQRTLIVKALGLPEATIFPDEFQRNSEIVEG